MVSLLNFTVRHCLAWITVSVRYSQLGPLTAVVFSIETDIEISVNMSQSHIRLLLFFFAITRFAVASYSLCYLPWFSKMLKGVKMLK